MTFQLTLQMYELISNYLLLYGIKRDCAWRKASFHVKRRYLTEVFRLSLSSVILWYIGHKQGRPHLTGVTSRILPLRCIQRGWDRGFNPYFIRGSQTLILYYSRLQISRNVFLVNRLGGWNWFFFLVFAIIFIHILYLMTATICARDGDHLRAWSPSWAEDVKKNRSAMSCSGQLGWPPQRIVNQYDKEVRSAGRLISGKSVSLRGNDYG